MNNTHSGGFTLMELLVVIVLLGFLITAGLSSFTSSLKKSRDSKRKNDLRQIATTLEAYYNDFGKYPTADANGNINGCLALGTSACTWGDEWKNTTSGTVYMTQLPKDPLASQQYFYESVDGSYFKLYTLLENTKDTDAGTKQDGYTGTVCSGTNVLCTYGISSSNRSMQ